MPPKSKKGSAKLGKQTSDGTGISDDLSDDKTVILAHVRGPGNFLGCDDILLHHVEEQWKKTHPSHPLRVVDLAQLDSSWMSSDRSSKHVHAVFCINSSRINEDIQGAWEEYNDMQQGQIDIPVILLVFHPIVKQKAHRHPPQKQFQMFKDVIHVDFNEEGLHQAELQAQKLINAVARQKNIGIHNFLPGVFNTVVSVNRIRGTPQIGFMEALLFLSGILFGVLLCGVNSPHQCVSVSKNQSDTACPVCPKEKPVTAVELYKKKTCFLLGSDGICIDKEDSSFPQCKKTEISYHLDSEPVLKSMFCHGNACKEGYSIPIKNYFNQDNRQLRIPHKKYTLYLLDTEMYEGEVPSTSTISNIQS